MLKKLQAELVDEAERERVRIRLIRIPDPVLELMMGILLAIAGVATSWGGYQAALWDGEQAAYYNRATAMRQESVRASLEMSEGQMIDISMFMQWLNAYSTENKGMEHFIRKHVRPEFSVALEAWLASNPKENPEARPGPFMQPEYKLARRAESERDSRQAEVLFRWGEEANAISDRYVGDTVIMAMVLFFIGVAQQFKTHQVRIFLTGVSILLLTFGISRLFFYPVMSPG